MAPLREAVEEDPYQTAFDHPKCIFVPSRELIRTLILALVEWGNEPGKAFLLRFGLLDGPLNYI